MTGIVAVALILAALVAAAGYAAKQREIAKAAERRATAFKAELDYEEKQRQKAKEIHDEQQKQRARVDTGDPGADFAGSLDVLSELAAKRRGT